MYAYTFEWKWLLQFEVGQEMEKVKLVAVGDLDIHPAKNCWKMLEKIAGSLEMGLEHHLCFEIPCIEPLVKTKRKSGGLRKKTHPGFDNSFEIYEFPHFRARFARAGIGCGNDDSVVVVLFLRFGVVLWSVPRGSFLPSQEKEAHDGGNREMNPQRQLVPF